MSELRRMFVQMKPLLGALSPVLLKGKVKDKYLTKKKRNKPTNMDYQCIVIYTIAHIAPFYPNLNSPSSSKHEQSKSSNGCLNWIKLQIKRKKESPLKCMKSNQQLKHDEVHENHI
ncbi:CLUMA_CG015815, isoform A [Clunio marinus]|uniref:CLUMA_CG015815, isoform A n=1 Tax=Clunio marinus TaxID=568069 RepID=A0A1J1IRQ9_9DIPT|nr:CLUMA_CG015815, isoform A [Clunio marinus]